MTGNGEEAASLAADRRGRNRDRRRVRQVGDRIGRSPGPPQEGSQPVNETHRLTGDPRLEGV